MGGRGIGRGNLLETLKKKKLEQEQRERELEEQRLKEAEEEKFRAAKSLQQEEEVKAAKLLQEQQQPVEQSLPRVSKGRGSLLDRLKRTSSSVTSEPISSNSSTTSVGRGSLVDILKKRSEGSSRTSGDGSGALEGLSSLSLDDTKSSGTFEPEVVTRQGESGKRITLTANYITLRVDKDKDGMYQYEVKFLPDIDSRPLRYKLLNQHLNELGNVKNFDGALLYLPIKLPKDPTIFTSIHPADGSTVTLQIIFKKKQAMRENIAFFNTLINRVLRALTLVRIGRHDFHPSAAHKVPQHNLEVWPGYVTSVSELEGGLKLNLDATHRVMRMDTVRDLMLAQSKKNPRDFQKAVAQEIIGSSVLTRYNNNTYKIDDIDWDETPMKTFKRKDETITLVDYYKIHYNIQVQDMKQPLLVHRAKKKTTDGKTIEQICLLIPELCFLSGITDSIRSDFRITKDLSAVTKVNPEQRKKVIKNFINQVNGNETTKKILSDWGLYLENDTVDFEGRVLLPEELTFGNNVTCKSANADWGKQAVNSHVLRTPNMKNWAIIYPQRNKKCCTDFLETFSTVCRKVNIQIGKVGHLMIKDDATESYVNELRKALKNAELDMVVIIFPAMRQDKYTAVKKICCVDYPTPSQVIVSKTISKPEKLKSVTEKIALQINCKLGGALWALRNPFNNTMVCGIDVYHAGIGQGAKASVAGFVASLDKMLTTWHSRVCMQGRNQELVDLLKQCLLSAINVFQKKNGSYPDKILIYRDGVGDGQLETVKNYEIKQFIEACSMVDPGYKPKICVIIVQKRVNTRIFEKSGQLQNPPPGTIVDSTVTRRHLYDFYLVPQLVRQGTVTPTHYIVLHDGAEIKTDHMQRFTFKLCHLYYNWPGTIRVPAPCQYAHKLAYLVGQSIKAEPNERLNNLLYYL